MKTLSLNWKRAAAVIVAACVALALTMAVHTDGAYAATKTYYASLDTKVKVKYSGFKKDVSQTWKDADLGEYRQQLEDVRKAIADGETEYEGNADIGVVFGTIKKKVTAKVSVGEFTAKKPKGGFMEIYKLDYSAAKSKYDKLKGKIKKNPIKYCGYVSYFASKNSPDVTIKIGGEPFALFRADYITLKKIGKEKRTKTTLSGQYSIGLHIGYKGRVTNAEVEKFLAAVTARQDGDTIEYSFTTPKVKPKNVEQGFGFFDENVEYTQKNQVAYSGYKGVDNKTFTVTETIKLKK